jgi:hypothetical protein
MPKSKNKPKGKKPSASASAASAASEEKKDSSSPKSPKSPKSPTSASSKSAKQGAGVSPKSPAPTGQQPVKAELYKALLQEKHKRDLVSGTTHAKEIVGRMDTYATIIQQNFGHSSEGVLLMRGPQQKQAVSADNKSKVTFISQLNSLVMGVGAAFSNSFARHGATDQQVRDFETMLGKRVRPKQPAALDNPRLVEQFANLTRTANLLATVISLQNASRTTSSVSNAHVGDADELAVLLRNPGKKANTTISPSVVTSLINRALVNDKPKAADLKKLEEQFAELKKFIGFNDNGPIEGLDPNSPKSPDTYDPENNSHPQAQFIHDLQNKALALYREEIAATIDMTWKTDLEKDIDNLKHDIILLTQELNDPLLTPEQLETKYNDLMRLVDEFEKIDGRLSDAIDTHPEQYADDLIDALNVEGFKLDELKTYLLQALQAATLFEGLKEKIAIAITDVPVYIPEPGSPTFLEEAMTLTNDLNDLERRAKNLQKEVKIADILNPIQINELNTDLQTLFGLIKDKRNLLNVAIKNNGILAEIKRIDDHVTGIETDIITPVPDDASVVVIDTAIADATAALEIAKKDQLDLVTQYPEAAGIQQYIDLSQHITDVEALINGLQIQKAAVVTQQQNADAILAAIAVVDAAVVAIPNTLPTIDNPRFDDLIAAAVTALDAQVLAGIAIKDGVDIALFTGLQNDAITAAFSNLQTDIQATSAQIVALKQQKAAVVTQQQNADAILAAIAVVDAAVVAIPNTLPAIDNPRFDDLIAAAVTALDAQVLAGIAIKDSVDVALFTDPQNDAITAAFTQLQTDITATSAQIAGLKQQKAAVVTQQQNADAILAAIAIVDAAVVAIPNTLPAIDNPHFDDLIAAAVTALDTQVLAGIAIKDSVDVALFTDPQNDAITAAFTQLQTDITATSAQIAGLKQQKALAISNNIQIDLGDLQRRMEADITSLKGHETDNNITLAILTPFATVARDTYDPAIIALQTRVGNLDANFPGKSGLVAAANKLTPTRANLGTAITSAQNLLLAVEQLNTDIQAMIPSHLPLTISPVTLTPGRPGIIEFNATTVDPGLIFALQKIFELPNPTPDIEGPVGVAQALVTKNGGDFEKFYNEYYLQKIPDLIRERCLPAVLVKSDGNFDPTYIGDITINADGDIEFDGLVDTAFHNALAKIIGFNPIDPMELTATNGDDAFAWEIPSPAALYKALVATGAEDFEYEFVADAKPPLQAYFDAQSALVDPVTAIEAAALAAIAPTNPDLLAYQELVDTLDNFGRDVTSATTACVIVRLRQQQLLNPNLAQQINAAKTTVITNNRPVPVPPPAPSVIAAAAVSALDETQIFLDNIAKRLHIFKQEEGAAPIIDTDYIDRVLKIDQALHDARMDAEDCSHELRELRTNPIPPAPGEEAKLEAELKTLMSNYDNWFHQLSSLETPIENAAIVMAEFKQGLDTLAAQATANPDSVTPAQSRLIQQYLQLETAARELPKENIHRYTMNLAIVTNDSQEVAFQKMMGEMEGRLLHAQQNPGGVLGSPEDALNYGEKATEKLSSDKHRYGIICLATPDGTKPIAEQMNFLRNHTATTDSYYTANGRVETAVSFPEAMMPGKFLADAANKFLVVHGAAGGFADTQYDPNNKKIPLVTTAERMQTIIDTLHFVRKPVTKENILNELKILGRKDMNVLDFQVKDDKWYKTRESQLAGELERVYNANMTPEKLLPIAMKHAEEYLLARSLNMKNESHTKPIVVVLKDCKYGREYAQHLTDALTKMGVTVKNRTAYNIKPSTANYALMDTITATEKAKNDSNPGAYRPTNEFIDQPTRAATARVDEVKVYQANQSRSNIVGGPPPVKITAPTAPKFGAIGGGVRPPAGTPAALTLNPAAPTSVVQAADLGAGPSKRK